MESIGRSINFSLYEVTKSLFGVVTTARTPLSSTFGPVGGAGGSQPDHGPGNASQLLQRVACASVSGMLMWCVISPLDVIRAQYYMDRQAGFASITRSIYRSQGLVGFYRGLSMTLARSAPVAGTTLPVFDLVHEALMSHLP